MAVSQEELERYRSEALALGASDARVISVQELAFDPRVPLKCYIPLCLEYGASLYCPPHAPDSARLQERLKGYTHGILVRVDIKAEQVAGPELPAALQDGRTEEDGPLKEVVRRYEKLYEVVGRLESLAFHQGHYLAVGFGAGSYHAVLCQFQPCLPVPQPERSPAPVGPAPAGLRHGRLRRQSPCGGRGSPEDRGVLPHAGGGARVLIKEDLLKEGIPVPESSSGQALELDVQYGGGATAGQVRTRIEAFVEMLRK